MGTDKRTRDLTELPLKDNPESIEVLLESLMIPVDDIAFGVNDAKRIKLRSILDSNDLGDLNPKTYRAMTPAGFKATVAAEDKLGVVRIATDDSIINKSGAGVLNASKIGKLVESIFTPSINIDNANKGNYLTAFGNLTVNGCQVSIFQMGKLVIMNGTLQGTLPGSVAKITVQFKNIPQPARLQAVTASVYENYNPPTPLAASIHYNGTEFTDMVFSRGTNNLYMNGTITIDFSATYRTK